MSTVSEQPLPERLSYTSGPALMTAVVASVVLLASSLFGWWALGKAIRDQITIPQAATLLFFLFFMIAVMLSIGYSRLWADDSGLTVRNGPIVRRYPLDQIAGLRLRPGDAWSTLLIKDGDALKRKPVLAIQFLEGERAQRKVRELRPLAGRPRRHVEGLRREPGGLTGHMIPRLRSRASISASSASRPFCFVAAAGLAVGWFDGAATWGRAGAEVCLA